MFSPYNPYGFPYPNPMQQMGQQSPFMPSMQSPAPTPPQPPQGGPDWIQAPTIKHVEQIQVQPGSKAWVMVQNEPVFALRVADQMGLVTTDYYRFEKIDPASMQPAAPEYVTRAEFEQFVANLMAKKEESEK